MFYIFYITSHHSLYPTSSHLHTHLLTLFLSFLQMVFSGEPEADVVSMCRVVGEQIKGLTGDYKELAPKARFFIMAIKDAMSARTGSAQEVAYPFVLPPHLSPSPLSLTFSHFLPPVPPSPVSFLSSSLFLPTIH